MSYDCMNGMKLAELFSVANEEFCYPSLPLCEVVYLHGGGRWNPRVVKFVKFTVELGKCLDDDNLASQRY